MTSLNTCLRSKGQAQAGGINGAVTFCLYYKVLERGRFPWPTATEGAVRLTSAQLAMLWEGMDWRRPDWGAPPARVG